MDNKPEKAPTDDSVQKQLKLMKYGFLGMFVIILIAAAVIVWALFFRDAKPDYAEHKIEPNAIEVDGDDDKMNQPDGGGAVSLSYSDEVTISLKNATATLDFTNPGKSNQDMVLQIVVEDTVIAESGRIKPGYQVPELTDVKVDLLSAGSYEGKFVVDYYNGDSEEKAMLNTEIPVSIKVTE